MAESRVGGHKVFPFLHAFFVKYIWTSKVKGFFWFRINWELNSPQQGQTPKFWTQAPTDQNPGSAVVPQFPTVSSALICPFLSIHQPSCCLVSISTQALESFKSPVTKVKRASDKALLSTILTPILSTRREQLSALAWKTPENVGLCRGPVCVFKASFWSCLYKAEWPHHGVWLSDCSVLIRLCEATEATYPCLSSSRAALWEEQGNSAGVNLVRPNLYSEWTVSHFTCQTRIQDFGQEGPDSKGPVHTGRESRFFAIFACSICQHLHVLCEQGLKPDTAGLNCNFCPQIIPL